MSSEDTRRVIAKSNVYKLELRVIRLKLWDLDEKQSELSRQDEFDYDALETADRRKLKAWKLFRTRNGLSNEAVS